MGGAVDAEDVTAPGGFYRIGIAHAAHQEGAAYRCKAIRRLDEGGQGGGREGRVGGGEEGGHGVKILTLMVANQLLEVGIAKTIYLACFCDQHVCFLSCNVCIKIIIRFLPIIKQQRY